MRKRRTRDIVIELTSLLDVVMILIFAVMIENSQMVKAEEAELAAANVTIEEMQDELKETVAEKDRITGDLTEKLNDSENRLRDLTATVESQSSELEKVNEAYASLEDENLKISEELKVALRKLSEGEIQELLERISKAELKNESFEYMNQLVAVYNVGIKSIYENKEVNPALLYHTLSYGRASSDEEGKYVEFGRNEPEKRDMAVETMKADLVKGIDAALEKEDVLVFLVLNYSGGGSVNIGYKNIITQALTDLTSKYDGKVSYRINVIKED